MIKILIILIILIIVAMTILFILALCKISKRADRNAQIILARVDMSTSKRDQTIV